MLSTGILVGGSGRQAEMLSKDEYATLRSCLAVLRNASQDIHGFPTMERRLLDLVVRANRSGDRLRQDAVAGELAAHLKATDQADEVAGFLHDGEQIVALEAQDDVAAVLAFVRLLQRKGWVAEFLNKQIAGGAEAGAEYPTPLDWIQALAPLVEAYAGQISAAREMAQRHPSLVRPSEPRATTTRLVRETKDPDHGLAIASTL